MPKTHQTKSRPRSPDLAWEIESEQLIRELAPPHRPALLAYLRHRHPSTRLFIPIDWTTTPNCLQATRDLLAHR